MTTVHLKPLTSKAKQLIKRFGKQWKVKIDSDDGLKYIIEPLTQDNPKQPYSRWLEKSNDKHFVVELMCIH